MLSFGNIISRDVNRQVVSIARHFSDHPFYGLTDIVPAYSSISFSFDMYLIHQSLKESENVFEWVRQQVELQLPCEKTATAIAATDLKIPVCYDAVLLNDLEKISVVTGLPADEIINIHSSKKYYVYMLGFLPGFAYMGEVDASIEHPRKARPEKVAAGSVAIAGKQTGIYPLDSFGGWHVLGHTPLKMFNPANTEPCLLKAGQEVTFYAIILDEYMQMAH